jgi:fluoride exporter
VSAATWCAVAVLGALGSLLRYLVWRLFDDRLPTAFPVGTLAVNLSGALALGILVGAGVGGDALVLAGTALLGAYTTFSTWMLETDRLVEDGLSGLATAYLAVSVAGGLAVTGAGWALGSLL